MSAASGSEEERENQRRANLTIVALYRIRREIIFIVALSQHRILGDEVHLRKPRSFEGSHFYLLCQQSRLKLLQLLITLEGAFDCLGFGTHWRQIELLRSSGGADGIGGGKAQDDGQTVLGIALIGAG